MVFALPKNDRYTLSSPDAIFIQREPDKFKIVERNDKVNSQFIKEFIAEHDDYYSDPITVYDKGVDPMRSMMYNNPAKRGGFQNGSGKFSVNDSFRPPMQTGTDLLPLFKKRNVDYIYYDSLPEFKQFLQSISCNKDLQKILKPEVLKTDTDINKSDPYKRSYIQVNNPQQIIKKTPMEIQGVTSTQQKLRTQHDSTLDKELTNNVEASAQTNKSNTLRMLTGDRATNNFQLRDVAHSSVTNNKQLYKNIVQHDEVDERRTKDVMSVGADLHTVHKQRDQVSYLGDLEKFTQQRGPETNVQVNHSNQRRDRVEGMSQYTPLADRLEVQKAQTNHTNLRSNILPQTVEMRNTLEPYHSGSVAGYRPQFSNTMSNAEVFFKEK
jgi:hypothetical protein